MTDQMETVLLGWARDADGGSQRFIGDDIYNRAGHWGMDCIKRDIPVIVTYCCRAPDRHRCLYFTNTLAMVPERAVPLRVHLRRPDEVDTLGADSS